MPDECVVFDQQHANLLFSCSMKNSKYFLALTLAIALNASCSKFEEGPAFSFIPAESRLTGEWVVVQIEGDGYADYDAYLASGQYVITFEFEEDGGGEFSFGYNYDGYSYSYGYTLDWDLDDDRLDVFMNGDLVNFEVQRLTNKEMKMKTLNDELFDNGVVFTMEKD